MPPIFILIAWSKYIGTWSLLCPLMPICLITFLSNFLLLTLLCSYPLSLGPSGCPFVSYLCLCVLPVGGCRGLMFVTVWSFGFLCCVFVFSVVHLVYIIACIWTCVLWHTFDVRWRTLWLTIRSFGDVHYGLQYGRSDVFRWI